MRKRLLFLFAISVVLTAASCGSAGETGPGSGQDLPASSEESGEGAESAEPVSRVYDIPEPELPELDYGGAEFLVFTTYGMMGDENEEISIFPPEGFLSSEGLTGEVVNDAVFNRNLRVEQKFNIRIKRIQNSMSADVPITAGEPFDAVMNQSTILSETIYTGAFLNMIGFPYLSLEAEYWSPRCLEGTIVDDLVYLMPCDIVLDHLENTGFLYFNKRILAENDLESPYDLVRQDRWTLDAFLGLVRSVHRDLNGDGIMDMEDLYGSLLVGEWRMGSFLQFYFGAGQTYTKTDPEQGRVLAFNPEIGQGIIDMLAETLQDKTICMDDLKVADLTGTSHWNTPYYPLMFAEGHSLFTQDDLTSMDYFREMEDDFGIVPNPKYNEEQKEYYQRVRPYCGMFALPATLPDEEKTGAVLEYWAWLSHYTTLPAYYEITIKQKRVRDEDTVEMLDIIRKSMVFEFGDVFYSWIPHYMCYAWEDRSFPNRVMSNQKMFSKRIAKYVKALRSASE